MLPWLAQLCRRPMAGFFPCPAYRRSFRRVSQIGARIYVCSLQELNADEIPSATKDGVTAIVIAGEALGISSPVQTRTPTHYM